MIHPSLSHWSPDGAPIAASGLSRLEAYGGSSVKTAPAINNNKHSTTLWQTGPAKTLVIKPETGQKHGETWHPGYRQ